MTPRQQRRLQQKLARKAQKHEQRQPAQSAVEPQVAQTLVREEQTVSPAMSEAKLAANRANAQLSCGPTSIAGKQIVSQNAIKHGLTGKFQVLPDESQSDFDRLVEGLMQAEQPADDAEALMVQQMAEALWLSNRCVRFENECFAALQSANPEEQRIAHRQLALFMRYQTTHERTFTRYSTELRKRRNERRRVERGFVSQKAREAQQERRAAAEQRKQELHELKVLTQKARLERLQYQRNGPKPAPELLAGADNCLAAAA